jgi:hypothetical protein
MGYEKTPPFRHSRAGGNPDFYLQKLKKMAKVKNIFRNTVLIRRLIVKFNYN